MSPITSLEKLSQIRDTFDTQVEISTKKAWEALNGEDIEFLKMHELTPFFFPEAKERDEKVRESCLRHPCITNNLLYPSLELECKYLKDITLDQAIARYGKKILITPIKVWDEVNWRKWFEIVNPEYEFAEELAPHFLYPDES